MTFLFATHDPRVMRHAARVITLQDGKILEDKLKTQGEEHHTDLELT